MEWNFSVDESSAGRRSRSNPLGVMSSDVASYCSNDLQSASLHRSRIDDMTGSECRRELRAACQAATLPAAQHRDATIRRLVDLADVLIRENEKGEGRVRRAEEAARRAAGETREELLEWKAKCEELSAALAASEAGREQAAEEAAAARTADAELAVESAQASARHSELAAERMRGAAERDRVRRDDAERDAEQLREQLEQERGTSARLRSLADDYARRLGAAERQLLECAAEAVSGGERSPPPPPRPASPDPALRAEVAALAEQVEAERDRNERLSCAMASARVAAAEEEAKLSSMLRLERRRVRMLRSGAAAALSRASDRTAVRQRFNLLSAAAREGARSRQAAEDAAEHSAAVAELTEAVQTLHRDTSSHRRASDAHLLRCADVLAGASSAAVRRRCWRLLLLHARGRQQVAADSARDRAAADLKRQAADRVRAAEKRSAAAAANADSLREEAAVASARLLQEEMAAADLRKRVSEAARERDELREHLHRHAAEAEVAGVGSFTEAVAAAAIGRALVSRAGRRESSAPLTRPGDGEVVCHGGATVTPTYLPCNSVSGGTRIPRGALVQVVEVRGSRARLSQPDGWMSIRTSFGNVALAPA